ncbi:MAG: ABC transporter permease, partial [Lactobacillus sp.]|nr:ABC transporter permease [Lactobacillus sp.]
MNLIVSAIGQGLLWALLGLGLYLTFRILNFADMTVEGTFPLGAAVAVANLAHGMSPYLATFLALIAGMAAGLVTGLLYTKGKIPILLAGILTMTAIYSINLRIMGGSNISLIGKKTLLNNEFLKSLPQYFNSVVLGIIVVAIITIILVFFLNTD